MRLFFSFAVFIFSSLALATAPHQKVSSAKSNSIQAIVGLGVGVVAEKENNNQAYDFRFLPVLRGGFDIGVHELLLELSGFQSQSGASGVNVKRQHEQVDLWYRYLFFNSPVGHPFAGLALGVQRDEVTTDYFGQASKDVGQFEAQLSVAGGYRFEIAAPFWYSGEIRLSTSNNYEPKVMPSAVIAAGFKF